MSAKFSPICCIFLVGFLCCSPANAQPTDNPRPLLSNVKVAVLYENVTDGVALNRSIEDTNALLKRTHADFLFRGFWKWEPIVESPNQIPPQLRAMAREQGIDNLSAKIEKSGKNYQTLRDWIAGIKRENPSLLFCGAIPAQHLAKVELDPITGRVYMPDETWAMALDPKKWNVIVSGEGATKEQLQAHFYGGKASDYDRRQANAYVPDITNHDFQSLLVNLAKKQIDLGADAIWIDMLLAQTKLFLKATNDVHHQAVIESYKAAVKIVDDIHRYGAERGKTILVGTWGQDDDSLLTLTPRLSPDFVTVTPSTEEIDQKQLNTQKWDAKLAGIRQAYGDIPIFAFIDWSLETSPMVSFSQRPSSDEQKRMLQSFDVFFAQRNVNFIYPVHGGYMGKNPVKKSFGKFGTYDSLAPEFNIFGTIEFLATEKASIH